MYHGPSPQPSQLKKKETREGFKRRQENHVSKGFKHSIKHFCSSGVF